MSVSTVVPLDHLCEGGGHLGRGGTASGGPVGQPHTWVCEMALAWMARCWAVLPAGRPAWGRVCENSSAEQKQERAAAFTAAPESLVHPDLHSLLHDPNQLGDGEGRGLVCSQPQVQT